MIDTFKLPHSNISLSSSTGCNLVTSATPMKNFSSNVSTPASPRQNLQSKYLMHEDTTDPYTAVTMTTSSHLEEQVASLTKTLEGIAKYIEGQDAKILMIMERVPANNEGGSRNEVSLKAPDIHELLESSGNNKSNDSRIQIPTDRLIPMNQLKKFIMGAIKDKLEDPKPLYAYVKPYT
ncbi:hypothetical protein LIER_36600 [Lithospermum erythrorhizon]|uniref:Uncharacterized protein n=1 Tax=Lithospermum erythrorhizon TaxID=34254 RepID=A0AAV3P873_LITER